MSRLGSQVTMLAIPLIAITVVKASTFEVGLLSAVEFAPFIIVGLPAGVWVDRLPKRPLLIVADTGRLVALATIPLAYELDGVTMAQLYIVAFVVGVLTVVFDVAYQSYLPVLVERDQLVDGNAKLAVSESASTVVGPSVAGGLIDLIGAPLAVIADAASFGVSAVALLLVRRREPVVVRPAPEHRSGMRAEIAEGLGYVLRHRLLRPIACSTATSNLFSSMTAAVVTIYMVRSLDMSPGLIGVTLGLGNVGFVLGALLSGRISTRLGVGPTIVWSMALCGFGFLLLPLATRSMPMPWLVAGNFLFAFGGPVYNIAQVSLRQAITPYRLQGRMNASMRFVVWGTMPIGSILGGILGTWLGLRPTLVIAGVGGTSAFLWVALSAVPSVQVIPENEDGDAEAEAAASSGREEGGDPPPGIGGVVGPVSGSGGVMDEAVLRLG
ncbi:MAG: hypothetical protein JWO68_163, partial [Actinomycetia bacterium]|nr:hypothetical protein [Actinomycetes bacterium]